MSAAVLAWHASWRDPIDWQMRVLEWVRRLGVDDPVALNITEIRITAAGDGQVMLRCIDPPPRAGADGKVVERLQYVPLTELPPPRPEVVMT
jgi:hypothetical protein